MGTTYRVLVPLPVPAVGAELAEATAAALDRVDRLMSTYRPDSELSRFNAHASMEPFAVSAETHFVISAAREISAATGGAFDITVGPLVDAWGFGPERRSDPPLESEIERWRENSGWQHIEVDHGGTNVRKGRTEMRCDLSAVAKGHAADQVAHALESLGCRNYMVEVGGELRLSGETASGTPWRIGIEQPHATGRAVRRVLMLSDTGVATSGDYRNFREVDGQRVSHVLDPRTGRPTTSRVASATVLHRSAMRADALATALLVMGEEEGMRMAERDDLAVLLLVREESGGLRETTSSRFRARMSQ